jgi:hypothetical protein
LQATTKIALGKLVQNVFPKEIKSHVHEQNETQTTHHKCVHKNCATYHPIFVVDALGFEKALKKKSRLNEKSVHVQIGQNYQNCFHVVHSAQKPSAFIAIRSHPTNDCTKHLALHDIDFLKL